jgi:RimJ/RimL family protein N-acetyltransferase
MPGFETARLRIRPFRFEDAPFIVELLNDPDWIRFIGDKNVRSIGAAETYLRNGPLRMYAEHGFGLCAVELRSDRRVLGMCGLIRRPGLDDVDLGFAFLPAFRGQGFATEAASATLAHGFASCGLRRIVAITDPDNVACAGVLTRAGMRFEERRRLGDAEVALYATGPTR